MNKYEEALDELHVNATCHLSEYAGFIVSFEKLVEPIDKAKELLQDLVDKAPYYKILEARATPMKPKMVLLVCSNDGFKHKRKSYMCKACHYHVNEENMYCSVCGQTLDWSEDEEEEI
jgi:hypothetical protein